MISRSLCEVTFVRAGMDEPTFPRWPCPVCTEGRLQVRPMSILYASAEGVHEGIELGHIERWDDYGVFAAILICDSGSTLPSVTITLADIESSGETLADSVLESSPRWI